VQEAIKPYQKAAESLHSSYFFEPKAARSETDFSDVHLHLHKKTPTELGYPRVPLKRKVR
jgi:hypothetical protein